MNRDTRGRIFGELVPRSLTARVTRNTDDRPQRRGALPGGQEGGPDHMLARRGLRLGGGRAAGQEPLPQRRSEPAQPLWTQLRGQARRTSRGDGLGVFQPQQKIKNRPKATGDQDQGVNIRVTEA